MNKDFIIIDHILLRKDAILAVIPGEDKGKKNNLKSSNELVEDEPSCTVYINGTENFHTIVLPYSANEIIKMLTGENVAENPLQDAKDKAKEDKLKEKRAQDKKKD